jgi:hypothetical protein
MRLALSKWCAVFPLAFLLSAPLSGLAQPLPTVPPPSGVPGTGPPIIVSAPCKPIESGSVPERIHVRCERAIDNRFNLFFVSATGDPRFAARALSVIEAAQLGDKFLTIQFDAQTRLQSQIGCPLGEICRTLLAVTMVETPIPQPNRCIFNQNRPGCAAYCAQHDDISCAGFCTRQPTDPGCQAVCNQASSDACTQFCAANPNNSRCGQIACTANIFGDACATFCRNNPTTLTCAVRRAECTGMLIAGCQ